MKKRPNADDSDEFDVDEPEEFEESGSDWDPEEEDASKKRKGRGKPAGKKPNAKKKKVEKLPSEDDEEEEDEEDEEGIEEEEEDSEEEAAGPKKASANGTTTPNSLKAFTNGTFVVLKSDFRSRGVHPLWKIDGKALLQKYVPFEQSGKTLYKNTSTYSGWTPSNQDQYIPAPVTYVQQGKKEIIVEFNRDKVRLDDESDGSKNETPASVDA